jgi:uncharacterized protein YcbK (DUF882 family)|tara:strand:- start:1408 stop:1734 length:327 start_codon:yes stop_codon:yes gene_type:complete
MDNLNKLAKNLQKIRERIGIPIRIMSGYRSPEYNKRVGGATRSQHVLAKAADLQVSGMSTTELANTIKQLIKDGVIDSGGVGLYETFVHYDVRGRNARWYGKGMRPKK